MKFCFMLKMDLLFFFLIFPSFYFFYYSSFHFIKLIKKICHIFHVHHVNIINIDYIKLSSYVTRYFLKRFIGIRQAVFFCVSPSPRIDCDFMLFIIIHSVILLGVVQRTSFPVSITQ